MQRSQGASGRTVTQMLLIIATLLVGSGVSEGYGFIVLRGGNTPTLWLYDTGLQRWSQLADVPVPIDDGASAAISGADLFVTRGGGTREFYRLTLHPLAPAQWARLPDLPEPVTSGGALASNPWIPNTIYALTGGGSSILWKFDAPASTWTSVSSLPAPAGNGSALAYLQAGVGFVMLLGDSSNARVFYEPDNWQTGDEFPAPIGVGAAVASMWSSCIYALPGGANGAAFYALQGGYCNSARLADLPVLPSSGAALIGSVSQNAFVYALAGEGSDAVYRYQASRNEWSLVATTPAPLGAGSAAVEYRGLALGLPLASPLPRHFSGAARLTIDPPVTIGDQTTAVLWGKQFPEGCESAVTYSIKDGVATGLGAGGTEQGDWSGNFWFPPEANLADTYRWVGHESCNGYLIAGPNPGGDFPRSLTLYDDTGDGDLVNAPSGLEFAAIPVGSVSPSQIVTVTNNGGGPLVIRDVAAYGSHASDFVVSGFGAGACFPGVLKVLEPKQSCTIDVRFRPTVLGPRTATVGIAHTAGNSFTPIAVTGAKSADTTPPQIACSVTPTIIWPPNGKRVPVVVEVDVTDTDSGVAGFVLAEVSVNEPSRTNDVIGFKVGEPSTSGAVRARRAGSGEARVYSFRYVATDNAGNTGSCTATVLVPHDQR